MIVKNRPEDVDMMLDIFEQGKQIMRESGNMHQWENGYPSGELLLNDIADGNSYRIEEQGKTLGIFTLIFGEDPTYKVIDQGQWLNAKPYGVIHRIASNRQSRNVLKTALDYAFEQTDNVRIDTHRDNTIMQHLLEKYGFTYCGIIYLANGDERLAYHKVKSE